MKSGNNFHAVSFIIVKVLDDEEMNVITAGAIVTVTVKLTRKKLGVSNIHCYFNCCSSLVKILEEFDLNQSKHGCLIRIASS